MSKKKEEGSVYLILDENQMKVLRLYMVNVRSNPDAVEIMQSQLDSMDLTEDANDFIDQVEERVHKMGWCDDPDCQYE